MNSLVELLKITIPAAVVFAAVYFLVKRFLDNDQKRREHQLKTSAQAIITPLKIQAYERIIIFLERINPNSLVVRVNKNNMTARQLHIDLISTVKSEYEHNLSQQIYISEGAWQFVKTAKEEIIQLINISSSKVPSDAVSSDLAIMILNITANLDKKLPSDVAIDFIKKEIALTL
ncbi:MAG: hypothetical protein V4506_09810 [Bacteroidota bacterium]